MTQTEFMRKWSENDLKRCRIKIDNVTSNPYSMYCCQQNDKWLICSVNEREDSTIIYEGNEDFIFEKLDKIILGKLDK